MRASSTGLLGQWIGSHRWAGPGAGLAALAVFLAAATLVLQAAYAGRIVAGVRVLGLDVGGQTVATSRALLEGNASVLGQQLVTLRSDRREWQLTADALGMRVEAKAMVDQAYAIGRNGNPVQRIAAQWGALLFGTRFASPLLEFDAHQLDTVLRGIAANIDRPPVDASIEIEAPQSGAVSVVVVPELPGARLQVSESAEWIRLAVARGLPAEVDLAIVIDQPVLTEASVKLTRTAAERMLGGDVRLTSPGTSWTLSPRDLAPVLVFERSATDQLRVAVDADALDRVLEPLNLEVGQAPTNARFDWSGGNLRAIRDNRDGAAIDVPALAAMLSERLPAGERTFVLPLTTVPAAVTARDGSRLGIKELVREGSTAFPGATPEKQHNIRLAASRIHGTIVPPGEIFSFNREVGPTTLDAGFKTGWGITLSDSGARTIPSVAGGICQVATTLFHPVFHAGYAIEQRQPHLYWIQSYGQPPLGMKGLDATVDEEAGLDFQFINTTPDHLLIQARVEATTLIFGLYGTKPAWDVKIEGPIIANVTRTDPTPRRQLDPTMPAGRALQVEAAQDGFDITVVRTVTQGEEVRRLPLRSHYLPAHNVILHGPEPPPPAESAASEPSQAESTDQPGPTAPTLPAPTPAP